MVQYTFDFDQSKGVDPQRLGGKCASLVALTVAGIPVPPGFVVTSEAYAGPLGSQRAENVRYQICRLGLNPERQADS